MPHHQNVPLAILITALASVLFATGATIQHLAISTKVNAEAENRSMGAKQLIDLLTNPKWLLGLVIITIGASGHIVGLTMAPVTVVQPVGILAVPWSVMMAARIHHHKITLPMWRAVAITIGGIVMFTLFSATHAAPDKNVSPITVLVGCIIVYAIGAFFGVLGAKGKSAIWRSLLWASGGSFFYGLSSALIKSTTVMMREPNFHLNLWFWALVPFLIGSYVIGGAMIQQGYACGPAEIVVGSMDTTDPIVAVGFGLIVLGEGANISPMAALGMAVASAIAILGVVLLSKNHPDSAANQQVRAGDSTVPVVADQP
jgi:drug/metabolite transporter (DMT)-like permease